MEPSWDFKEMKKKEPVSEVTKKLPKSPLHLRLQEVLIQFQQKRSSGHSQSFSARAARLATSSILLEAELCQLASDQGDGSSESEEGEEDEEASGDSDGGGGDPKEEAEAEEESQGQAADGDEEPDEPMDVEEEEDDGPPPSAPARFLSSFAEELWQTLQARLKGCHHHPPSASSIEHVSQLFPSHFPSCSAHSAPPSHPRIETV
jgi:hypothetical protein